MIRILAALLAFALAAPATAEPVVNAPAGSVRGEALDGVNVYRGLPYAKPPVGRLRWRPTEALQRWRGTREVPASQVRTVLGDTRSRSAQRSTPRPTDRRLPETATARPGTVAWTVVQPC